MLKVLIGIPVLNNTEMTRACLESLFKNTETKNFPLDLSLLVIDNGSSDDILGLLRGEFHRAEFPVYYLRNPKNLGVAIAWNQILRFSFATSYDSSFYFDYYVISNNDIIFGPDWLQPLVKAMEEEPCLGWIASLENGSTVMDELVEAHSRTREYYVDPNRSYRANDVQESLNKVYEKWGGHESFCRIVKEADLPLFIPEQRSAVCFMVRPSMIQEIGYFDEDFSPVGISEDLEYFLRMRAALPPPFSKLEEQEEKEKWKYGLCGKSIVHHNWCMTRQGPSFDGRKREKEKEKNWKRKFGKSRKYYIRRYLEDK